MADEQEMTDAEITAATIAHFQEHERQMEALLVKHIGAKQLEFGRAMNDPFFKKQWYGNRLYDLGVAEGRNAMRMRRCKSWDSPIYQKYQAYETELRQAKETLNLEMVMMGHDLQPFPEDSWVVAVNVEPVPEVAYVYATKEKAKEHASESAIVCSLKEAKRRGFKYTEPRC
jgi:hypothetical protein